MTGWIADRKTDGIEIEYLKWERTDHSQLTVGDREESKEGSGRLSSKTEEKEKLLNK